MPLLSQKPRLGVKFLRGHFRALLRCVRALQTLVQNDFRVRSCIGPCLFTNKLYADGKGTSYTYTPDGKLASRTWARTDPGTGLQLQTLYSYDPQGQMTNISYGQSLVDAPISFTYDRLGRQKVAQTFLSAHSFSYSPQTLALTNETIIANGVTNIITRTQDTLGRSVGFSLSSGGTASPLSVSYTYDPTNGRFSAIESAVLGVTNNWQYSHLQNSDLISGVSNSMPFALCSLRSYEPNRNLLTSIQNLSGTNLISQFDYTNDEIGRRTQRIDQSGAGIPACVTNSFSYNTRSELTSAEMGENSFSWILDNIGNRESASRNGTNRIFEANELNQYASISNGGLKELSYDFDGNLTNDAVFAHTFNGENRLVMSEPLNVTNGSKRVQSAYDYQGRRFRKVVETWDGSSWASSTTNIFVYDGFNLIQEQDGAGGVIRSYVRGLDLSGTLQGAGGTGGLLAMISGSNTYFYLGDANGNITELVDTNGDVVAHYEWDAYGNRLNEPGENEPENPFGFSSQYCDKETGLDMYIFRPYSPELERFVQRDPLGERGGIPLYGFVLNDPVGLIDLLGALLVTLPEEPVVSDELLPEESNAFGRLEVNPVFTCEALPCADEGKKKLQCKLTATPTIYLKRADLLQWRDDIRIGAGLPSVEEHERNHYKVFLNQGVAAYKILALLYEGTCCCNWAARKVEAENKGKSLDRILKKWQRLEEYNRHGIQDREPGIDFGAERGVGRAGNWIYEQIREMIAEENTLGCDEDPLAAWKNNK